MAHVMDRRRRKKKWVEKILRRPRRHAEANQTQAHAAEVEPAPSAKSPMTEDERQNWIIENVVAPLAKALVIKAHPTNRLLTRNRDGTKFGTGESSVDLHTLVSDLTTAK